MGHNVFKSLCVTFTLTFAATGFGQTDPTLPKCPTDWKVEVLAKWPQIKYPSVVTTAPDGRIFVGEDPMDMPGPPDKPIDRVLCFHPDGHVTVFADKLYSVFGLLYLDGKLYIHQCPKLTVYTDDNGVGKDPVELFSTNPEPWGGTHLNDHIPSNIRLGMDGFIYMSTGDKGIYGAVGKDGSRAELHGGGVLRFHPDGTGLEVYSSGTRNHLDLAINSEDEIFTYDNTDDGNGWWTRVTHMVDGGYYGYPHEYKPQRPFTLWMMTDYGGGSPTGASAYNEDALPAEYRGDLFFCEWGRKQLLRIKVDRDGGSYKINSRVQINGKDFLTSGTEDFRPTGMCVTQDGDGFYIADWNFGGWKKDQPAGRLLKVIYTGKSEAMPKPAWYVPAGTGKSFQATTTELIEGLKHPAQSVRLVAQRRLAERGQTVVAALTSLLGDKSAAPFARWSAIWTLNAIDDGVSSRAAILVAAKDTDLSVREQALRQLGTAKAKESINLLADALKDPDAAVRFRAATDIGRLPAPALVPALINALDEKDFFARYAVFHALNRIGRADATTWSVIAKGLADSNPRIREGTLFAMRETYDLKNAQALAGFIEDIANSAEARAEAVPVLAELHRHRPAWEGKWWGTQPIKTPPPAKSVEWEGTPIVLNAVRATLKDANAEVRKAAIAGIQIDGDSQAGTTLRSMFAQETDVEVRRAILKTLTVLKDAAASELIASIFSAADKNAAILPDAVEAAAKVGGKSMTQALTEVTRSQTNPTVLLPALEALGGLKTTDAIPAIVAQLKHENEQVRAAAINALAQIGGQPAITALLPVLTDKSENTRRSAVTALGTLKAKSAVPQLLTAYADKATRFEAIDALALMPDVRALDAYLEGLGGANVKLRTDCSHAIMAIQTEALPLVEAKLDSPNPPPAAVVAALQKIYGTAQPVTQWRILGPFSKTAAIPFEVNSVALDQQYKDIQGKNAKWKSAKVDKDYGKVDLRAQMSAKDDVSAFAYAEINSTAARDVVFMAGSDDGLALWLNGKKIFEDLHDRGWKSDQFEIHAKLNAGMNRLVAQITQTSADWAFSVSMVMPRQSRLFETVKKQLEPKDYDAYAMSHNGNAEHGRALFSDLKGVACIKCHRAYGQGGEVGPDLMSVGAKYNRAQLIESVLYPSKLILDGYQQTMVDTKDGESVSGIVREENAETLTLVDASATRQVIKKSDIKQRKLSNFSLMPDGLQAGLSVNDFADLIAFIESLKEKPAESTKK